MYRDYDAFMIAQNGGQIFTLPFLGYDREEIPTLEDEILYLIERLQRKVKIYAYAGYYNDIYGQYVTLLHLK